MGQAMTSRFTGLSAGNARVALLGAVSLVVVCVALGLVVTGVASGEVAATLLFLPVFAAGFLGGRTAGYLGAVVAAVVYVALRRSDLADAGIASAGVLSLTRAGAYLVVGHVGTLAQALVPDGDAAVPARAGRPDRSAAAAADRRRALVGHGGPTRARGPAEPAWDQPWEHEPDRVPAHGRQPVLAGVGSPATGGPRDGDAWYDTPPPTTMSSAWPPEPPTDPWRDDPSPPRRGRPDDAPGPGGWDDGGAGWHDEGGGPGGWDERGGSPGGGWQDGAWQEGPNDQAGPASSWQQAGDETRPLEDDSWAAVQQSWRQQHGVPLEDEQGIHGGQEWGDEPSGPADQRWGPSAAPADPWSDPRTSDVAPAPLRHDPSGRGGAPPADTGWGPVPVAPAGGAPDPWADGGPVDPGGQGGGPDEAFWGDAPGGADGRPDPWADTAPTGGTWPQAGPAPADQWSPEQHTAHGGWSPDQAPPNGGGWSPEGPAVGREEWPPAPHEAEPQGWDALTGDAWTSTGQTEAAWDDRVAHGPDEARPHSDLWPPEPAPAPGAAWPAAGAFDTGGAGHTGGVPPVGDADQYSDLPAVDHETGLWTAKFLRDRLAAERARSRRSGHPFSLVLVQVPDGPLAQLPYRRQLTLLRELGYQFVAGGVVDHLVHVPDQAQHWFAVILPDTDRSGAQVLERRLRLGIGGYLSSRGLRLRELESASLTAPDDDPAMGAIWEGLIGPDDAGSPSRHSDY